MFFLQGQLNKNVWLEPREAAEAEQKALIEDLEWEECGLLCFFLVICGQVLKCVVFLDLKCFHVVSGVFLLKFLHV